MKLYVWEDVLVDYTEGMMVAVANSADEAREELRKKCSYLPESDLAKEPQEFDLSAPCAFFCWGGG